MSKTEIKAGYWPLIIISGVALMALAASIYLAFFASAASPAAHKASEAADRAVASAGMTVEQRAAMEAIVRDYILKNPEIITEAVSILQQRDATAKLGNVREQAEKPFPGAVMGNPAGDVVLVEFSDYACGYCRKSVADVQRLIAEDKGLKIVMREMPILSQESALAAKWALAAAMQGKYAAFHDAMFAAGRPNEASVDAAARKAGLNMDKARAFIASKAADAELAGNIEMAQTLNIGGTPSWIVGDQLLEGAVGYDKLKEAIAAARKAK